jgi:hypothetical protein
MVIDGFSIPRTRRHLNAWLAWWVRTTNQSWSYQYVLSQFIRTCHDNRIAAITIELLLIKTRARGMPVRLMASGDGQVTVASR